ncbi:MAG: class I SAM-dependent methyltransferase [Bacteroidota bacterium]
MTATACKVCGNTSGNTAYTIKEMQLGLRENFEYQRCRKCGLMQLQDLPEDMGRYYPNDQYYSFNAGDSPAPESDWLRRVKASYLLYNRNKLLGSLLSIGYNKPAYYDWMRIPNVQLGDAILDVGCGGGELLSSLYKIGFTNLTGIDPFINKDIQRGPINIYKQSIYGHTGMYDYIMLNHAFEHMDEPLKVLQRLNEMLNPGKYLLIRTPVMGMYSWKNYHENWMDLDAPRHIIVHSLESIKILASQAGFEIQQIAYDANYMSLIGSDQYSRDIALNDPNSYMVDKEASNYSVEDIDRFKAIGETINRKEQADQAAFYLYKP